MTKDLIINLTRQGEDILVSMGGDLDISSSADFRKQIEEEFTKEPGNLIFDLAQLDYIDSTGLGCFMTFYGKIKDTEYTIKINNAKENILKIFRITELDKIFGMS